MDNLVLLEPDAKFLEDKGYVYNLFSEGNILYLVIDRFPFPDEFYTPNSAELFIKIPPGYPMAPLDMFWTNPEVRLIKGGSPDRTIANQEDHFGKKWQRWSRHYINPWRPGIDGLRNFIQSIHTELRKGI